MPEYSSALKMEVARFSETTTAWHFIPEDNHLHYHHFGDFKSPIHFIFLSLFLRTCPGLSLGIICRNYLRLCNETLGSISQTLFLPTQK
jgi:hypothetical protein